MSAPFILKIKYSMPMDRAKDVLHAIYIATRPRVVKNGQQNEERAILTIAADDLEKELDYEIIDDDNKYDEKYLSYIAKRKRSHGLFSSDSENLPNLEEAKNEILEHRGVIWRAILSVKEEDAVSLGYDNRKAWEEMLQSQMNMAAEKMGIERSNLKWVAAFHEEKGHPHCHVMFWEKNPERTIGKLGLTELKEMKKVFAGEIYREERLKHMMVKDSIRQLVREEAQGSIFKAKDIVRDIRKAQYEGNVDINAWFGTETNSMAPELSYDRESELAEKVYYLSEKLPGFGRIALKFMPEDIKDDVRTIADYILGLPHFKQEVEKYIVSAESLARTYTTKPEQLEEARIKAYEDLRDRVAQVVLRGAVESKKLNEGTLTLDEKRAAKALKAFSEDSNKKLEVKTPENIVARSAQILNGQDGLTDDRKTELLLSGAKAVNINLTTDEAAQILKDEAGVTSSAKRLAAALKLCGASNLETQSILELQLKEQKDIVPLKEIAIEDVEDRIQAAVENNEIFTKKEFDQVCKNLGLELNEKEHPWQPVGEIIDDRKDKAVCFLKEAGNFDKENAGWTGFTMYAGLKMLGVEREERQKILADWVKRNDVNVDVSSIVKKLENFDKLKGTGLFLRDKTWNTLLKNLGGNNSELLYPWKILNPELNKDKALKVELKVDKNIFNDTRVSGKYAAWTAVQYGRFLHAAGIGFDDIQEKINKMVDKAVDSEVADVNTDTPKLVRAFDDSEIQSAIKYVSNQLDMQEQKEFFFGDKEWQRFTENMGIQADNPWEKLDISKAEIIEEKQIQAIEHFKEASVIPDVQKNGRWTGFTMYAGMKMLGVEREERQKILADWVIRNDVKKINLDSVFNKIDKMDEVNPNSVEGEIRYLQKSTWEKLASNLGISDASYPWATKENPYVLSQEKALNSVGLIKESSIPLSQDKFQWTAQKYVQLLISANESIDSIKTTLRDWADKSGYDIDVDKVYDRATTIDPIENMRSLIGAKDDEQQLVNTFAKTLTCLEKTQEETKQIIMSWSERSRSDIDEIKVDTAIDKAINEKAEAKEWNTQYFVGKQSWQELCERVGVKADWAWGSNMNPRFNIINTIWKACWKSVQRERMQSEAQAEVAKRQMLAKAQAKDLKNRFKGKNYMDTEEEKQRRN